MKLFGFSLLVLREDALSLGRGMSGHSCHKRGGSGHSGWCQLKESLRQDPFLRLALHVGEADTQAFDPFITTFRAVAFPYNQKEEKGHCRSTLDKLGSLVTPQQY